MSSAGSGRLDVLPWFRLLAFDGERLGQEHPYEGGHQMASTIAESASPTTDALKTGIVVRFSPTNVTAEKYKRACG